MRLILTVKILLEFEMFLKDHILMMLIRKLALLTHFLQFFSSEAGRLPLVRRLFIKSIFQRSISILALLFFRHLALLCLNLLSPLDFPGAFNLFSVCLGLFRSLLIGVIRFFLFEF